MRVERQLGSIRARNALPRLPLIAGAACALVACEASWTPPTPSDPIRVADISMSIAELEEMRRADPDAIDVNLVLGERYRRMNMLEEADETFERALNQAGLTRDLEAQARGGLGRVAQSRDDLDGAERHFRDALDAAEAGGSIGAAREQRFNLAVLERVRGDFVAACRWYDEAGSRGSDTALTSELDCDAPDEVLALAAAVWRAHAAPTMLDFADEALSAEPIAEAAEAAVARGDVPPKTLAPVLGDYAALMLAIEGPEAAEAVARRALALDPNDAILQIHLISPLILLGRYDDADAATEEVVRAWRGSTSERAYVFYRQLATEFWELSDAGMHDPHMNAVLRRLSARMDELRDHRD